MTGVQTCALPISDLQKKFDALTQKIKESQSHYDSGMKEIERVRRNLRSYGSKWTAAFETLNEISEKLGLTGPEGVYLSPLMKTASDLAVPSRQLSETSLDYGGHGAYSPKTLKTLFEQVSQLRAEAGPLSHALDQEVHTRQVRLNETRSRLEDLKKGIKPYEIGRAHV